MYSVKLGIFWTGIEVSADGSKARLVGGTVQITRGETLTGTTSLYGGGPAGSSIDLQGLSISGKGTITLAPIVGTWVNLQYGATVTATYTAAIAYRTKHDGVWYNDTADVTQTITFPARAWQLPAAATGLNVTRNSDVSHLIKWTRTAAPTAVWTTVYVERRVRSANGWSAWSVVATLAGTATQWADTTTIANRGYQWRVRAWNSSGYSAYATSSETYTSPGAVTGVTVTKSGTTVTVSWTRTSVYETYVCIQWAQDGVWGEDWWRPAGSLSQPYTVDPAKTHQFRVRSYNGLFSPFATSPLVTLTAPPLAPDLTVTPAALDASLTALTASWTHRPTDSTVQVGYKLRYRLNGAGAWTELTGTTATSRTIPAGTLANGAVYEFQACTRGDNAAYGPWSPSRIVTTAARPVATPAAPDPGISRLAAAWGYTGATAQAAWKATLYDAASVVLEALDGTGDAGIAEFGHVLDDATTYTYGIAVRDGLGLWSVEATTTWTTDLIRPPAPTLTAQWEVETGRAVLSITTPPAEDGQPEAVHVEVYRDGLPIGTTDPTGDFIDPIPPTNRTVVYTALAWADPPVATAGDPLELDTTSPAWVYLNAGPDFGILARLLANPRVTETISRTKVLHTFAGQRRPVEYIAPSGERQLRISGEVDGYGARPEIGPWQPFADLAEQPAPICYRDPLRRVLGSISEVSIDHAAASPRAAVSFTLTEVEHDA